MENLTYEQQLEDLSSEESDTMRLCVRTLLSRTFIVRSKDRSLFRFASTHRDLIDQSLRTAGFQLFVDEDYGVCMLRDKGEMKQGQPAVNRKIFYVRESVLYCALTWLYMRKMNDIMDRVITISVQELMQTLEQFEIRTGYRTAYNLTTLKDILRMFSRYNLVEVSGTLGDPDCVIVLYPTLMFGLNPEEMQRFLDNRESTFYTAARQTPEQREEAEAEEDEEDPEDDETGDADTTE